MAVAVDLVSWFVLCTDYYIRQVQLVFDTSRIMLGFLCFTFEVENSGRFSVLSPSK
jgi:hypothetical protein